MRRAYSTFKRPVYGTLVSADDALVIKSTTDLNFNAEIPSKYDPATLANKCPAPRMIHMPETLSNEIGSLTRDSSAQELRQKASALYKSLRNGESHRPAFTSLEADAHIQATSLQNYASIYQVLEEARARLPGWNPKRVLDIGFGPATGLLVANELFPELERKVSVIFGHYRMRRRAQQLLRLQESELEKEKQTIFKHQVPSITATTKYDLIIATHQLFQSGPDNTEIIDSHAQRLTNLLNPGGVLVLVERGDAFGFESVARARQVIMRPEDLKNTHTQFVPRRLFSEQVGLKIVAPCSHQGRCPLQIGLHQRQIMKNPGAENWCRFSQNVHRPKFSMEFKKGRYLAQEWLEDPDEEYEYGRGKGGKALSGKGRPNSGANEMASHSYLIIQRSSKVPPAPEPAESQATLSPVLPTGDGEQPPRVLKTPLKRRGHVIMETCAPSGNIEHWTVTKSQGKLAYHDARKASQGDRWALGAKSVQVRGGISDKLKDTVIHEPESKTASVDHWNQKEDDGSDILSHFAYAVEMGETEDLDPNASREKKLDRQSRQTRYRNWAE